MTVSAPSTSATWENVLSGSSFDTSNDQQAASGNDLVGDATNAMMQSTRVVSGSETYYYFRVRLGDATPSTSVYIGLDLNPDPSSPTGVADMFIEANVTRTGSYYISFHEKDPTKAGTGPSNTGWLNTTAGEQQLGAADSYIALATAGTDLDANKQTDSWVVFGFSLSTLQTFAASHNLAQVTATSPLSFQVFTSTAQVANGDIGGVNDKVSTDLSKTWSDLGLVTVTTLDSMATGTVLAPIVGLHQDTGITGDGITSVGQVDVSGLVSGGTWQYSLNGGSTWLQGTGTGFTLAAGVYASGTVLVRQTDSTGHVSASSSLGAVTVDASVGAPTGLDLASADDTGASNSDNITTLTSALTISGSGENGASVQLFDDANNNGVIDSGELLAAGTVSGGVFAVDVALASGTHNVRAIQTDLAGNVSSASTGLAITVDTSAPAAPTALDLAAADDTGLSNTDNVTSQTSGLTITGNGENGSTVKLFDDANNNGVIDSGELLATGTVSGGVFAIDVALLAGTHNVRAIQTDSAGNVSPASTGLSITVDTSAPSAPTTLDLAAADDTGSSDTDNLTGNTSGLTITGTAESGAAVKLFDDVNNNGILDSGEELGSGTASAGIFSIDVALASGTHHVRAIQTDAAGNASSASTALDITVDTSVTAPGGLDLAAADDTGTSNSDNLTSLTTGLTISGTGENGATVTLFDDANHNGVIDSGEQLNTGTVSGGVFSIDVALASGTHNVRAIQTDAAGNASSASTGLTVIVDASAPAAQTGTSITAADQGVSGIYDSGDTLTLRFSEPIDTSLVTLANLSVGNGHVFGSGATIVPVSASGGYASSFTITLGAGTTVVANDTLSLPGSKVIDQAGNQAAGAVNFTVPSFGPWVKSMVPTTGSGSGSTIQFTVVFSAAVTGVDASDFTLTKTGTADGSVLSVSGSGDTYTVTVSTVANTEGGLRLDLNSSGTGIKDTNNLAIVGGFSAGTAYALDRVAPVAPTALDLAGEDDTGKSSSDNLTSKTTGLTITGSGETGASVEVFDDANNNGVLDSGELRGTATVVDGQFSVDVALTSGLHHVRTIQTDVAGNASSASASLDVTVDTIAPTVAVSLSDTALKTGDAATVTFTFSEEPTGFSLANVTSPAGTLGALSGPVDNHDGTFSYTASFTPDAGVEQSGHAITVGRNWSDAAGNAPAAGASSNSYDVDTRAPLAPSFDTVASDNVITDAERDSGVTLTGTTESGSTVTLDLGGLARSATVTGTTWSYTLTAADYLALDEGAKTFKATAIDAAGNAGGQISKAVSLSFNDAPTGGVTITGEAKEGKTLTADIGTLADEDGLGSFTYVWYADDEIIDGATGRTLNLLQAHVGKAIKVEVSYTDGGGTHESVTSSETDSVENVNDLPTGTVTITGIPDLGATLTADNTIADKDGLGEITYTWYADGEEIPGGIGSTLFLADELVGKHITVVASYTDGQGHDESMASGATEAVRRTVDGLLLDLVSVDNDDGTSSQVLTIPLVTPGRLEEQGVPTLADIPLVKSDDGTWLLKAQLPVGFGLSVIGSEGPKPVEDAFTDLIREIKAHTKPGSADQKQLTGGGSGFLEALSGESSLIVKTIVPVTATKTAPIDPLIISGTPSGDGAPMTALVIDARGLPTGTQIQLEDVSFATISGAVHVIGGAGAQNLWGDGARQFIELGDDGGVVHAGGGVDTIVGGLGDDALFGGDGGDRVMGGDGDDMISGGNGNDTIVGGRGADILEDGYGRDTFVFNTELGEGQVDTIAHFNVGPDTIQLSRAIFTKVGKRGWLKAEAFHIGAKAADASDRIIYDAKKGVLYYDADGTGSAAQIAFANLSKNLKMTEKDFFIA